MSYLSFGGLEMTRMPALLTVLCFLTFRVRWQYPTETFDFKVDLRASATVAALNEGVMSAEDLLEVSGNMYLFQTDDATEWDGKIGFIASFDPKFPDMAAVLVDNSTKSSTKKFQQRIGYSLWNVKFSAWYYSWEGTDGSSKWEDSSFAGPFRCPDPCASSNRYCSTPDFVFEYSQTGNDQAFKVNLYADELFTINRNNMDPGYIGCATSTIGSGGKLGLLEPESAAGFQKNLLVKPFVLTEDYFACTPKPMTAFFEALGIAQGNATIFFGLVVMFILLVANVAGVANSALSDDDVAATSRKFAEALHFTKVTDQNSLMNDAHKDLQATLKEFLSKDFSASGTLELSTKTPSKVVVYEGGSKLSGNDVVETTGAQKSLGSRI